VLVERPGVLKPGEPFDLARLHALAVLLIGREVRQTVLIAPEILHLAERLLQRVARSDHQLRARCGRH